MGILGQQIYILYSYSGAPVTDGLAVSALKTNHFSVYFKSILKSLWLWNMFVREGIWRKSITAFQQDSRNDVYMENQPVLVYNFGTVSNFT